MYSPDEIEKKRLMAVKLREDRMKKQSAFAAATSVSKTSNNERTPNKQPNFLLKQTNNSSPRTIPNLSNNNINTQPNYFSKAPNNSQLLIAARPLQNNQNKPDNVKKRMNDVQPMLSPPLKQAKLIKPIEPASFFSQMNTIKGTYRMITASRFEVDVPYHQPLIEFFKKFPSKLYDQQKKLWNFDIEEYENFRQELKSKLPQVALVGIPKFVVQTFLNMKAKNNTSTEEDLSRIDRRLWDSLMPFQREGISFGVQKKGRCFIADDMGLGKTIQALGIAHYYMDDWPLLIVTPLSVRFQWSEAIFEHLPSIPTQHVHQFAHAKDCLGTEKITVVSYDLLTRSMPAFEKKKFGVIILDESHLLKNYKTERTKAVQRLTNQASRIILLSGTPALSRPIELYSQLCLIMGSFMRLQEFGVRYCDGKKKGYGWDYNGSSNITELQLLLRSRCLLRRLKSDVLKQLPPKIRRVIMLDPSLIDDQTKETSKIAAKLQQSSSKNLESHSTMLQLYSASSSQRLRAVRSYVKDLLENDKKFLIFAHHQCVLSAICEVLEGKSVQYILINGKTSSESRKQQVDRFQNCDDCLVAVLSITAANAGITLTAAHFVVFAELYWNPGILVQAEDRVHRIGQDSSVLIQYLVAKKTVDDYLWPLIQKKLQFLARAGLNQDFSLRDAELGMQKKASQHEYKSQTDTKTQTTMDSFLNSSGASKSSQLSNSLDKLLNEDDADFADVDLDSIVFDE